MFIAFEGPDDTGKSTSAATLAYDGVALYNVTKAMHKYEGEDVPHEADDVVTYDRIDWFSHMVYRLSLPDQDWNDDRPRTVFAMPDTHLVVKLHRPDLAQHITVEADSEDAATEGRTRGVAMRLAEVNPMYYYFAKFLMDLNETRGYALFKTVSIVEVANDMLAGTFSQQLRLFSSPVIEPGVDLSHVTTDEGLLAWLRDDDRQH